MTEPTTAAGQTAEEGFVEEFAAGWRDPADADSFADHFDRVIADDIRLIQPQLPTAVGRRAFREAFARPLFELIPDLHATVESWAAREELVLIEIAFEGTLGGRPIRWRGVDRITLRDGVAVERQAYLDPSPLLRAVALRPRAWPRFLRVQTRQLRGRLRSKGESR